jgi:hypothetical protein
MARTYALFQYLSFISAHDPGALCDDTAPAPVRVYMTPPLAVVV